MIAVCARAPLCRHAHTHSAYKGTKKIAHLQIFLQKNVHKGHFFSMDIIRLRALCCSATSVSAVYRYTMGTPTKLAWAMFWWGEAEVTARFMLQRNIRQRGLPIHNGDPDKTCLGNVLVGRSRGNRALYVAAQHPLARFTDGYL